MPVTKIPDVIPLTVVGGRGPHGLALHLLLQARGLSDWGPSDYCLVDEADTWLPLYGPDGPMQAAGELRSPRELDFAFGCAARAMKHFVDEDGSRPLKSVYSLHKADCESFNLGTEAAQRAPRLAFWRYATPTPSHARAGRMPTF